MVMKSHLVFSARNERVNTNPVPIRNFLTSLVDIMFKDIQPRNIPKVITKTVPVGIVKAGDIAMIRVFVGRFYHEINVYYRSPQPGDEEIPNTCQGWSRETSPEDRDRDLLCQVYALESYLSE